MGKSASPMEKLERGDANSCVLRVRSFEVNWHRVVTEGQWRDRVLAGKLRDPPMVTRLIEFGRRPKDGFKYELPRAGSN